MSLEWFESLLHTAPCPMLVTRGDAIVAMNPAAAAYGLTPFTSPDLVISPAPARIAETDWLQDAEVAGIPVLCRCLHRGDETAMLFQARDAQDLPDQNALLYAAANLRTAAQDLNLSLDFLANPPEAEGQAAEGQEAGRYAALALRTLYRMKRLANHLELAQRLSAGTWHLCRRNTDIRAMAEDFCREVRDLLGYQGLRLEVSLPEGRCFGFLDPDLVRVMLWELISNAIRHADGRSLGLTLTRRPDRVIFTVINHPGEVRLPEGLYRYFAAPRENPAQLDRVGLGLHITRMAAALHGGTLLLASGDGSVTAALQLPTREGPDSQLESDLFAVNRSLVEGLTCLSTVLPPEAYCPEDLLG